MLKRFTFAVLLCLAAFVAARVFLGTVRETVGGPGNYPLWYEDLSYAAYFPARPEMIPGDDSNVLFLTSVGVDSFGVSLFKFDPELSDAELAEFLNQDSAVAEVRGLVADGGGAEVLSVTPENLLGNPGWLVDLSLDSGARRARVSLTGSSRSGIGLAYVSSAESFSGEAWRRFRSSLVDRSGDR